MSERDSSVGVYIDFDNIIISRYDQVHGKGAFTRDRARYAAGGADNPEVAAATVDLEAIIDYASTFGSVSVCRAYADWSMPANTRYRNQLVKRAVELVQMFPTAANNKNGADIRLAVDVMEDLFRLDHLSHVVIVAGDSDFVPLAQRSKRLGKQVIGIGVAGATSKSLAAVCDVFASYDAILSVSAEPEIAENDVVSDKDPNAGNSKVALEQAVDSEEVERIGNKEASRLLVRSLKLLQAKNDSEWVASSAVKNQMVRMNPAFQEASLKFASFTEFVKSRGGLVELKEDGQSRSIRLRKNAKLPQ